MSDPYLAPRLAAITVEELRADLRYLTGDPLPRRTVNAVRPGAEMSTLAEADAFLERRLGEVGLSVERESYPVQAFRRNFGKSPKSSQYAPPRDDDPWYTADNLSVRLSGSEHPDQIIVLVAHKDSQSWVPSPGAHDNGAGTVALLAMARALAGHAPRRSWWLLWCNEEHRPWTSANAAQEAKARGDDLVAIFNVDSLAGRAQADIDARRPTLYSGWTEPPGDRLAALVGRVNAGEGLGLEHHVFQREYPNDDDGSFVKAGYPAAIMNLGSWPYADPCYHDERDTVDRVDVDLVARSARAILGAALLIDRDGMEAAS